MLINYSKEVIRSNPNDIISFSREYFEQLLKEQGFFDVKQPKDQDQKKEEVEKFILRNKVDVGSKVGLPSFLGSTRQIINSDKAIKIIKKSNLTDAESYKKNVQTSKDALGKTFQKVADLKEDEDYFYAI